MMTQVNRLSSARLPARSRGQRCSRRSAALVCGDAIFGYRERRILCDGPGCSRGRGRGRAADEAPAAALRRSARLNGAGPASCGRRCQPAWR